MLDFIVLGQVPGTGWQLSFLAMVAFGIMCMVLSKSLRSFYRYRKFTSGFGQIARYFVLLDKKPAKKRA